MIDLQKRLEIEAMLQVLKHDRVIVSGISKDAENGEYYFVRGKIESYSKDCSTVEIDAGGDYGLLPVITRTIIIENPIYREIAKWMPFRDIEF